MVKMKIPARDRESVMRSTEVGSIQELMFGTALEIDKDKPLSVDEDAHCLHIYLKSTSVSAECPCCKISSDEVHCTNFRHPQWMPVNGMTTFAHIELKRFRCRNEKCPRKTFVEQLDNARRNQQRSDLVNLVLFAVSIFCSDITAAMICKEMGIRVSHDSSNRILRHISIEDDTDIDKIGVDDVCLRKGQTYHTVIYDGNDHHLLALLDGRDGVALKEWLKEHPKITAVARDRAGAYASAITEILPKAMQVADRFHILQNLLGYLNEIFKANIPSQIFIKEGKVLDSPPDKIYVPMIPVESPLLEELHYDNTPPMDENGNEIAYCNKKRFENDAVNKERAKNRQQKHKKVLKLRQEWFSSKEQESREIFARKYSISIATLNKYLNMSDDEVEEILNITEYKKRKTDMDDYMNIVFKMLSDGHKPALIYSYIKKVGFEGSETSLAGHIKAIAWNNFNIRIGRNFYLKEGYPEDVVVIRRFDVLKYITINDKEEMKGSDIYKNFENISEKYPFVKYCSEVWDSFHETLMGEDPDKIDSFLEKYENTAISPFVNGIKKDIAPVKNAISSSMSSGFVEGGNCRYKATKRLMFGRSGIKHLFQKTYAISIIMRQQKSASSLIENWLRN